MLLPHPTAVLAAILVAAPATDAVEREASCRGVAMQYEIARAEVRDAERVYQRCLAAEDSRNGCVEEFSELDFAQDRFEHAAKTRRGCGWR